MESDPERPGPGLETGAGRPVGACSSTPVEEALGDDAGATGSDPA